MALWSSGIPRSSDKLKPFYLYYHKAYGYQTWQDNVLPGRAPTQMTLWYRALPKSQDETNIFTTIVPVATKFGRFVT